MAAPRSAPTLCPYLWSAPPSITFLGSKREKDLLETFLQEPIHHTQASSAVLQVRDWLVECSAKGEGCLFHAGSWHTRLSQQPWSEPACSCLSKQKQKDNREQALEWGNALRASQKHGALIKQGFPRASLGHNHKLHPPALCSLPGLAPAITAVIKLKQLGLILIQNAYFLAFQRRNHKSRNFSNINSEGWNIPRNKQTKLVNSLVTRQMHRTLIPDFCGSYRNWDAWKYYSPSNPQCTNSKDDKYLLCKDRSQAFLSRTNCELRPKIRLSINHVILH